MAWLFFPSFFLSWLSAKLDEVEVGLQIGLQLPFQFSFEAGFGDDARALVPVGMRVSECVCVCECSIVRVWVTATGRVCAWEIEHARAWRKERETERESWWKKEKQHQRVSAGNN